MAERKGKAMIVFEFVLIMLAAVLLSNLVNRFFPSLSVPLVQIALGVAISMAPLGAFGFEFELDPKLFFVLFIAPLIFHISYTLDKNTLWKMKGPILGAAVALVFITVVAVGSLTNFLIPAIPLAAAFALIGALGPTDDVAVIAVAKRTAVPPKIMAILSGESIINDASGIVCFQFAIAAMMTGSFSAGQAAVSFALLGIGGLLAGVLMTQIKYGIVKWLRSLGMANVTLHILIEVLTPFVIYMIAEAMSVSGILAVFAAGATHSFMREKFNPETAKLNIAQDSVWEFLTFTLEGMVFVMLGAQLPKILKTLGSDALSMGGHAIAGYMLLLTAIFAASRFLWWIFFVPKKAYQETGGHIGAAKAAAIFSLAGARGAITLASVMSIPILLDDGAVFPERGLIILLASGVIVLSLLITNFALPLFVGRKPLDTQSSEDWAAYSEIMRGVVSALRWEATEENRPATELVIRNYSRRSAAAPPRSMRRKGSQAEGEMRAQAFCWMKEHTNALLKDGKADRATAEHFLDIFDEHTKDMEAKGRAGLFTGLLWFCKQLAKMPGRLAWRRKHGDFDAIFESNVQHVLEKLNETKGEGRGAAEKLASEFELMLAMHHGRQQAKSGQPADDAAVHAVVRRGFSIERELIQEMFEANRISRGAAKEMRAGIAALEAQLHSIDF